MKYCLEKFVTNCDKGYYKLRQVRYYKLRQGLLQIVTGNKKIATTVITNCDSTLRHYQQTLSRPNKHVQTFKHTAVPKCDFIFECCKIDRASWRSSLLWPKQHAAKLKRDLR